jgi:hypothetical protein
MQELVDSDGYHGWEKIHDGFSSLEATGPAVIVILELYYGVMTLLKMNDLFEIYQVEGRFLS